MTRTLSLSHQQNSPGLFIGRGKVPRKIQRERGSLGSFLRPDHRTGATSLVVHFLKVRGVDASASWWGKLRSHTVKGLAVVKEKLWSFVPSTPRMDGCSFNHT